MDDIVGWPALSAGARYDGPVLILRGESSGYIRPEDEPGLRALFPQARFATVAKAGHWLHAENPAGFLEAITPFLEGRA